MIDVSAYIEKLEILKEWTHIQINAQSRVALIIHLFQETGQILYDGNPYKYLTFEQYYSTRKKSPGK